MILKKWCDWRKRCNTPSAVSTFNGVVEGKTSHLVEQSRLSGRSGAQMPGETTAARRVQRVAIEDKMRLKERCNWEEDGNWSWDAIEDEMRLKTRCNWIKDAIENICKNNTRCSCKKKIRCKKKLPIAICKKNIRCNKKHACMHKEHVFNCKKKIDATISYA